jgi:aspartate aminotransferase-like enzyme
MKQTLFTVGPVEMYPETLRLGGLQLPYFRTPEFSSTVKACDAALRELAGAPADSRSVLLTASGTGAMEAAAINVVGDSGRALVIRGGSFGERFGEICEDNGIAFDAIDLEPGTSLPADALDILKPGSHTAVLVNAHETSTGLLYDVARIGEACRRAGALFVVDGISAFLCDYLHMEEMGIDLLIASSQKALGLPPGLSILVLAPRALERVMEARPRSHYFGLRKYLGDAERGQTPFTPAVGVVLQLSERLESVRKAGVGALVRRSAELAAFFRSSIAGLPFAVFPDHPSNALTALTPTNGVSAYEVYRRLSESYGLIVTPNGGSLKDRVFRVGHMGNLDESKLGELARAMKEVSQ